jgi:hypothetical protein
LLLVLSDSQQELTAVLDRRQQRYDRVSNRGKVLFVVKRESD